MAEQEATYLAEKIIHNDFGPVVSLVARTLLHHGRLHLTEIAAKTKLSRESVAGVILTLIQHNLASFTVPEEDERSAQEYVKMDLMECLMRLRWGRMLALTQEEFGDDGRKIIQAILEGGKLRLPDIHNFFELHLIENAGRRESRRTNITNLVYKLLIGRYIHPTSRKLHLTITDELFRRRKLKEGKDSALKSAKERGQIKNDIIAEMREMRVEETKAERGLLVSGVKRKGQRGDDIEMIDPKAMLRVNYDRFDVLYRNKLIEAMVADRYNKPASYIVKAFMKVEPPPELDTLAAENSASSTMHTILSHLTEPERDSLSLGLGSRSITSKSKIQEILAAYASILAGEDNNNAWASDGVFMTRNMMAASAAGAQYTVAYEKICTRMKRQLMEAYVESLEGGVGRRVFNAVLSGDKVTEEMVIDRTLLGTSDARNKLGALKALSMINFQIVTRSSDRSNSRASFLYSIDPARAYSVILGRMYKSLANIRIRKEAEFEKYSQALDTSLREAVVKDPTLMPKKEMEELKAMEEGLQRLSAAEERMEVGIFILRDLPGGPASVKLNDPFRM